LNRILHPRRNGILMVFVKFAGGIYTIIPYRHSDIAVGEGGIS